MNEGTGEGIANAVTASADKTVGDSVSKINAWQSKASNVDKSQGDELEGFKSQIATDPTKVNAGLFQKSINAGYNDPTQANATQGYGDAYNAFTGAKNSYQSLAKDDWASRSSAVTDVFKQTNPTYNRGSAILDTFIAQGDAKGQEAFKSFTDKNADLTGFLSVYVKY
ncbi:MAG: hypothetical protein EOP04_03270 [Proteobacteria bacterium]|nr:MAG: hypothetical protein EOP04_03270 [Pseudomonadota bacterium]